jgi:hypothetical protein
MFRKNTADNIYLPPTTRGQSNTSGKGCYNHVITHLPNGCMGVTSSSFH